MNINQAAAIMGKKGGESGTGDSKRRSKEFYMQIAKERWSGKMKPEDRFWEKVEKKGPDECWLWLGFRDRNGYGRFTWQKQGGEAHRASWIIAHGEIPKGMFVLHNCPGGDNPSCVNPAHLFLGTHIDNIKDGVKKNQFLHRHGEANPNAILTDAQALEIRRDFIPRKVTHAILAQRYNVPKQIISDVLSKNGRRTFKHI